MKDRIALLIKARNLTAAQFADEIGVQKSSISHIISGRNNPSLDFMQKIMLRFPDVNLEWLILGKGEIFKSPPDSSKPLSVLTLNSNGGLFSVPVDLFSEVMPGSEPQNRMENELTVQPDIVQQTERIDEAQPKAAEKEMNSAPAEKATMHQQVRAYRDPNVSVIKIVELYSDNSFAEFFPKR